MIFFEASKDLRLDESIFGVPVEMGQRQTTKDAATTVLLLQNAPVLSEIVGADGMFNDDRIKAWKTNYANRANQPDGRIDAFSQGGIGDCFLLSAVNDMAKTPEGRRQIQNSISNNQNNGSYSIQLAGDPNKTVFTVTQAEVDAARAKGTVEHEQAVPDSIGRPCRFWPPRLSAFARWCHGCRDCKKGCPGWRQGCATRVERENIMALLSSTSLLRPATLQGVRSSALATTSDHADLHWAKQPVPMMLPARWKVASINCI